MISKSDTVTAGELSSLMDDASARWPLAKVMEVWHWTGFFVVIAIAAGISALLLLPFLNAQAPRTASEA